MPFETKSAMLSDVGTRTLEEVITVNDDVTPFVNDLLESAYQGREHPGIEYYQKLSLTIEERAQLNGLEGTDLHEAATILINRAYEQGRKNA